MKVVLVRKLADQVDGIDLTPFRVGDVLDVCRADARLLAAEGWAVGERRAGPRRRHCGRQAAAHAAEQRRGTRRR